MDDTLEEKAPRPKARTGSKPPRARPADSTVAEAKEAKVKTASTKRGKSEETKPARKAPAKRKSQADTKAAASPAAKQAKAGNVRKPRAKAPVEVPAVAQAAEPAPDLQPAARVELPPASPDGEGKPADVTIHPIAPHPPAVHPHDDGLEFGLSPVDLAPDSNIREEAGLGWFVRILAISSVLLVLFNSFAIDKWSREQPVTGLNSQVLIAARQLHEGMKSLHLDAPLEGMRSVWHGIRDAQWPGSAGNREEAATGNSPGK